MSRDRSTGWKNGKIDNMVGLVDILNEYIFWLVDILKKYKIPVDRAGWAGLGWASCLKDSLCLGTGRQAGKMEK